jgi:hypothetical protein
VARTDPAPAFALQTENSDASLPLQTWTLATWPDGSLKWTGHALGSDMGETALPDRLRLVPGSPPAKASSPVRVRETADAFEIEAGAIQCRIPRTGDVLVSSITRGGRTIGRDVRLICLRRDQPELAEDGGSARQERFTGVTTSATVEQSGPIRAVVRIDGRHKAKTQKGREWLPFTVRLYFYANSDAVRLTHTFVFDGDENKDFISGLGVRFSVPLSDPLQDRHVRFAGENGGIWGEAARTLTGLRRDPGASVRTAQVAGQMTPPASDLPGAVGSRLELIPAWGDFSLFSAERRRFSDPQAHEARSRLDNRRCGKTRGGSGLCRRRDRRRDGVRSARLLSAAPHPAGHPKRRRTRRCRGDCLALVAGRPADDLRFYHDGLGMTTHPQEREGLEITYEDYEKGWGTPQGVARTSEIYLWALPATPSRETLAAFADTLRQPPLLACRPEHLHKARVFSSWSLPERRTASQKAIEDQLDTC